MLRGGWIARAMSVLAGFIVCTMAVPAVALGGTIAGTVRASGGAALPGVSVGFYVHRDSGWTKAALAVTGASGAYASPDLGVGIFRVVFSDPKGLYSGQVFDAVPFHSASAAADIAAGADVTVPGYQTHLNGIDATLTLSPECVTGTVRDAASGAPAAGVVVVPFMKSGSEYLVTTPFAVTAADGTYGLRGLAAGTYRVGFTDSSELRFSDLFFAGASQAASATDVVFDGSTLVTGVDVGLERLPVTRIAAVNRFDTAAAIARRQFGADAVGDRPADFRDLAAVIVACGEDRAAADPLAAGGLGYAYQVTDPASPNYRKNAPMVLTASAWVPAAVHELVAEVGKGNGTGIVRLLVVGGTASVPDARVAEIVSRAAASGVTVVPDRLVASGGRYDLAAAIATRMKARAALSGTDPIQPPSFALLANGADPGKFFDALSLAPISANTGAPVLLVSATTVPPATLAGIGVLGVKPDALYVAGGRYTVTGTVFARLGIPASNRLAPDTGGRYDAARYVADAAIAKGWLAADGVGVAAKLPDALTGGAMLGDSGYPLLLTAPDWTPTPTTAWLTANKAAIGPAFLFGGKGSANLLVLASLDGALLAP